MNKNFTLTIDQGNSKLKARVYKDSDLVEKASNIDEVFTLINELHLSTENCNLIISNVTKESLDFPNLARNEISKWFTGSNFLNMPVDYSSTIGQDRLVSAYFAFKNYPNSWVIDCGTFTTIDYISSQKFEGGYIIPGMGLLWKSYNLGKNLKSPELIEWELKKTLPKNTEEAIAEGLGLTIFEPIYKAITLHTYDNILITGGASEVMYLALKSALPTASIHLIPDLLHLSLLKIAQDEL